MNHVERFALLTGFAFQRVKPDYNYDLNVYLFNEKGEFENGSHIIFRHEKPESVILLKQARANEKAHPAVLASAITNVIYSNVANAKQIELLTKEVVQR